MSKPSSSFDSRQLQNEIETIKKMRQNYGTDWLLSTANLFEKPMSETTPPADKEASAPKRGNERMNELLDEKAAAENEIQVDDIVESFPVYRSIEFSVLDLNTGSVNENGNESGSGENSTKNVCILSVSEKYLVEKDETNSNNLYINEIAKLEHIKLIVDSKYVKKYLELQC